MAVVAILLAAFNLVSTFEASADMPDFNDYRLGAILLAIPPLLLASISLAQRRGGKVFSIISLVITVIFMIVVLGL